jgi:PhoPQ-activated pathogenicity-related protein
MNVKSFVSALILSLAVYCMPSVAADSTALDDYVDKYDPSYGFTHERTRHRQGYTVFVVRMTSQTWRSPDEVDRTLWEHEVLIAVPWVTHSGNQNTAILIVNGGTNTAPATDENDQLLGILATVTGSVAAMVSQVPNQRLTFPDEAPESRIEDELLAYGMDKYLLTGDPEWLVQLPMTKAVVRAMDTVQTFAAEADGPLLTVPRIDDFIVLGGSKRGWATWLTAAVEARKGAASRVRAVIPASIDLLNLDEQFVHHWEAYGFYAPAVQDYAAFDLGCRALTPGGQSMLEIIDPFEYRDRLTMPKLILNSAGDQFFLPDSSQFYFDALPGPKQLRYTLNTDHSQGQDLESIILPTLSWLSDVLDDKHSPGFTWELEPDGRIRVQTTKQPERVRLWQATNPDARDFRLETIGAAWTSTVLQPTAVGEYVGYVSPPARGWTAYTVELTFPGSTLIPTPLETQQIFTTDVQVTPAELPFRYEDSGCPPYEWPVWLPDNPASADNAWTSVGAPAFFVEPVVIAGPPTYHGGDAGVVRLRRVDHLGFELRFQEYDYRQRDFGDTYHAVEDIHYAVLETGRHIMSDGSVWEVGSFDLGGTGTWANVDFAGEFTAPPHLFLTVQTNNGAQAVSVRARDISADGFHAALFEEEALMDGHLLETVGYLAVYSADRGGIVDLDGKQVPYLLQTVTADHRWVPVLSQRLKLEEEQSRDREIAHIDETVHVLALGKQLFAQQVSDNGGDTTALRRLEPSQDAPMEWGLIRGVDHDWQTLPFAKFYVEPVVVAKPVSSKGDDPGVIRLRAVSGEHAELRYQEWLGYLDGWHTQEDIFYLVSEAGQHSIGGLEVEADSLLTDKLGRASRWEGVLFNALFLSEPLVLSSVMTEHGSDPVTTRIRGLDASGFALAMDEQENKDDGHALETVGWVAIETGSAQTSDGRRLDAFFAPIDHSLTAVDFSRPTAHRHPSVVADIDSAYGMDPVFLRYANLSNSEIALKLSEEESADAEISHLLEDVGIFVAE